MSSTSIKTHSERHFDYINPTSESIYIGDIAWSLARQGRFLGHTNTYPVLSVAEHSVNVAKKMEKVFTAANATPEKIFIAALTGLLHDASEAYMADIPSPLKRLLPDYCALEKKVQDKIYEKFEIVPTDGILRELKKIDTAECVEEDRLYRRKTTSTVPLNANDAYHLFLARYDYLCNRASLSYKILL